SAAGANPPPAIARADATLPAMTHSLPMQYITDIPALRALADAIRQADWVALDTEFMREKTYYPQLCLLQLATKDIIACVDPLALEDLTPLYDALFDPGIVKVLHAARQDYEIFFHATGRRMQNLDDAGIVKVL